MSSKLSRNLDTTSFEPSVGSGAKLSAKIKSKLGHMDGDEGKRQAKNDRREEKGRKGKSDHQRSDSKVNNSSIDKNDGELLREIEALGGSHEDLRMLKDLDDNDNEVQAFKGGNHKLDKDFSQDLSKLIDDIGLESFVENTEQKEAKPSKSKSKKSKEKAVDKNQHPPDESNSKSNKKPQEQKLKEQRGEQRGGQRTDQRGEKQGAKRNEKSGEKRIEKRGLQSNSIREKPVKNSHIFLDSDRPISVDTSSYIHNGKPMITPRSDWYSPELKPPTVPAQPLSDVLVQRLHEKAKTLLSKENEVYTHENNSSTSQKKFLSQLLTAGTLSDKIGSYTLLIQESPLHSIKYLDSLLALCKKKSRGSALQSIAALKDLFIGGVLPDRKLKWFKNQPLNSDTPIEWLIIWAFEDWLKAYFFSLLQVLETLGQDSVVYVRSNAVLHILDLLKSKPEQEANLLRLGVNKLGDSDKKVASRVSYLLLQLEQTHPAMKSIIIDAISGLVFRSGSGYHARYYSAVTLNQTIIAHKDIEVANSLMKIYLSLFEKLLAEWEKDKPIVAGAETPEADKKKKKPRWNKTGNKGKHGGIRQEAKTSEIVKEEENAKLTAAILTGMNRAFPFSKLPEDLFNEHLNTLYRVTHSSNFNTGIQSLSFIFQISQTQKHLSDRYYRTLYESLLDPRLATSSKMRLYLNLVFKSLKADVDVHRVQAFAKRAIQVANHWSNVGAVLGVLYLFHQLQQTIPGLHDLLEVSAPVTGDEELAKEYDGRKRDPLYANADASKLWELLPLLQHYHPAVNLYAENLVLNEKDVAVPDMSLHSLSHFLDRFVYKNPKQKPNTRGSSIMQPLAGSDNRDLVFGVPSKQQNPANIADWSKLKLEDIEVSEQFFYRYFHSRNSKAKSSKGEEQPDNLDEDEVWNALVKSNPELGDDDDIGSMESDFSINDSDISSGDEDVEDEQEAAGEESEVEGVEDDVEISNLEKEEDSSDFADFDDSAELLGSDEEVDIKLDAISETDESNTPESEPASSENKRTRDKDSRKAKKQKLKDLPVFASADDYAQYLESSDEDYS